MQVGRHGDIGSIRVDWVILLILWSDAEEIAVNYFLAQTHQVKHAATYTHLLIAQSSDFDVIELTD
jgi:hypothetical protein